MKFKRVCLQGEPVAPQQALPRRRHALSGVALEKHPLRMREVRSDAICEAAERPAAAAWLSAKRMAVTKVRVACAAAYLIIECTSRRLPRRCALFPNPIPVETHWLERK